MNTTTPFDPANPFADFESDFEGQPAAEKPRTFSPEFSVAQSTGKFRVEVPCPKCRGSGHWVSYAGYKSGECFRCHGTGKIMARPEKSPEQKARDEAAKIRKTGREAAANELAVKAWGHQFPAQYQWLLDNANSFDFAASVLESLRKWHRLTDRQVRAIDNILAKSAARAVAANQPDAPDAIDLTPLRAGMYAVPDGETRLKVRIKKPGPSKRWHGFIFVDDGAGYGMGKRYGSQGPTGKYRGEIQPQLRAILADPMAAMAAYGHLTGSCGVCGRLLEDEESVKRGIGPVCFRKLQ
jgi:hypothetical protein